MKICSYLALVTVQHQRIQTIFCSESDEILLCVEKLKCGKERNVCFDHRLYFDKMADKIRRQALTVQENEELAEVIRKYPYLYDKSKKEYEDKNVTENGWKEVADQLDFIQNGES